MAATGLTSTQETAFRAGTLRGRQLTAKEREELLKPFLPAETSDSSEQTTFPFSPPTWYLSTAQQTSWPCQIISVLHSLPPHCTVIQRLFPFPARISSRSRQSRLALKIPSQNTGVHRPRCEEPRQTTKTFECDCGIPRR